MKQAILTDDEINEYLAEPIFHPTFTEALEHIDKTYRRFGRRPASCYVIGESGVGKSTLAITAKNEILAQTEQSTDATIIPVVMVALEAGALPDEVRKDILEELGVDHSGYSGRKLRKLLEKQLKVCGVHLILIDEFQHLVRNNDKDVNRNACNFIKKLIHNTGIPVVMLGVPEGKKLFQLHNEMRTRFSSACELLPMSCDDKPSLVYFTAYLADLMRRFPLKTVDLSEGETPLRVMLATGGNLRTLEILLSDVLAEHRESSKKLTLNDYQNVYKFTRQDDLVTKRGRVIKPFKDSIDIVKNDLKNYEMLEFKNG
jgi:chromosomal replication initiation ATPase DnaA